MNDPVIRARRVRGKGVRSKAAKARKLALAEAAIRRGWRR